MSATIGGKKSNSYISLGYLKNNGIVKNTDSERYSLTVNTEAKVSNWLRLGARARLMRKVTNQPYDGIGRVIYMMANGHPFSTPYLQDGKTFEEHKLCTFLEIKSDNRLWIPVTLSPIYIMDRINRLIIS